MVQLLVLPGVSSSIATGTPAGVAAMHKPPAWLKAGSSVTVSVEGLGSLTNPVSEGPAANV